MYGWCFTFLNSVTKRKLHTFLLVITTSIPTKILKVTVSSVNNALKKNPPISSKNNLHCDEPHKMKYLKKHWINCSRNVHMYKHHRRVQKRLKGWRWPRVNCIGRKLVRFCGIIIQIVVRRRGCLIRGMLRIVGWRWSIRFLVQLPRLQCTGIRWRDWWVLFLFI